MPPPCLVVCVGSSVGLVGRRAQLSLLLSLLPPVQHRLRFLCLNSSLGKALRCHSALPSSRPSASVPPGAFSSLSGLAGFHSWGFGGPVSQVNIEVLDMWYRTFTAAQGSCEYRAPFQFMSLCQRWGVARVCRSLSCGFFSCFLRV